MSLQACQPATNSASLRLAMVAATLLGLSATTGLAQSQDDHQLPPEIAARALENCNAEPPHIPVGKSVWNPNLWPGGVVPYVYDANTDSTEQFAIRTSMNILEAAANIHFVERTNQANYLLIHDSPSANNSQVGMVGGAQTVNIHNWNYTFIMCHELMHALGVWHEQSRTDRDQYVTINTENIAVDQNQCGGSCAYNFEIEPTGAPQGAYDFDSVMHYGQYDFSGNGGRTITVLPPNESWQSQIGQTTHLSTGDMAGLVSRYGVIPSATWTQRVVAGPAARDGHAMAYDTLRHQTVLFGGTTAAGANAETWEWDGTAWAQRVVAGPTARAGHAMAYDSDRHVTVLFGGSGPGASFNNQTWEWDGTAWTQRVAAGPSGRNLTAMAYDSARHVTVLFGGATGTSTRIADTWEWNGATWTQRAAAPPTLIGRAGHSMAYDSHRGVVVLIGGINSIGGYPGDTWEWNGITWTQRATDGPSPRTLSAMAYDPTRAFCALYGGWAGTPATISNQNWLWSGTAWSQRASTALTGRYNHAMAYDASRGVSVLFGGTTSAGKNAETWELGSACDSPTFSLDPSSQSYCAGNNSSAVFQVVASGSGSISYQWRKDGGPISDIEGHISGTTSRTLTITGINTGDGADYSCTAITACGSATSNPATLTVNSSLTPVSVAAHPNAICVGQSSTLTADSSGQPMSWFDAATDALITSPVSPTVTTQYYAVANPFSCASNHSQLVTVTVGSNAGGLTAVQVAGPGSATYCTPPDSLSLQAVGGTGPIAWSSTAGDSADECGNDAITGGEDGTLVLSPAPSSTTTYYARTADGCSCVHLVVRRYTSCPADIGAAGGLPGADCSLDNNDFIAFITYFFEGDTHADVGIAGGFPGSDGSFDNNDFISFINQFFEGCT